MHFYAHLQYLVLGTLDSLGRPWVSVVTGEQGFVYPMSQTHIAVVADVSCGDPIIQNLETGFTVSDGGKLIAGVGVDFTNRRRNKGFDPLDFGSDGSCWPRCREYVPD